ncbi:hypothetical protein LCGC14_2763700, partial [marine sediment metagenome]
MKNILTPPNKGSLLAKILSLCDYTGTWGGQYEDEYEVEYVDLQHGADIRLFKYTDNIRGIIAQPPCDHFAVSGARWWKNKGDAALIEGLQLVDACMRIILVHRPIWWVLENPVGRLRHYIGRPSHTYNPCDYGDPYTKRTCLWGEFTMPQKNPVEPTEGSKMHLVAPGPDRKNIRSATP